MTVNHDVTGSSPVGGAKKKKPSKWMVFSFFAFHWFQLIISRFAIIRTTTERAKSVVCMRARPVDDAASITEGQRSKSLVTHRHGQRFWVPQPSPKPNPDNISLGSLIKHWFEPSWGSQKDKAHRMVCLIFLLSNGFNY